VRPRSIAASALGALLVGLVAHRYAIDQPGDRLPLGAVANLAWSAAYLAGVGLLAVGWYGVMRQGVTRLRAVLAVAGLVHGLALLGPPYLSSDPLTYALLGKVIARDGRPPPGALTEVLPAGDPWMQRLPPRARTGGDIYGPAFDLEAAAIARISGDNLRLALRLHQLLAALAMFASGLIVYVAAGAQAAGTLLLSPLAVIEATQNAHNDALMVPTVALFALWWNRGRGRGALVALGSGVLVKVLALVPVAIHLARALLARTPLARPESRTARRVTGTVLSVGSLATVLVIARFFQHAPVLQRIMFLLGSPSDPFDYCTRSVECLPRALLREVAQAPTASWMVGLSFRALGALWIGYVALRAAVDSQALRWLATGLFGYFLYLHNWAQSWYYLSLLPLLPWADPRLQPAMRVACVSAVGYYAFVQPFMQAGTPVAVFMSEALGALVTIVPPTFLLWRGIIGRCPGASSPSSRS
jgi:hypothetical protein